MDYSASINRTAPVDNKSLALPLFLMLNRLPKHHHIRQQHTTIDDWMVIIVGPLTAEGMRL